MADRFSDLSDGDRSDALEHVASKIGRPAHLLEKDVWVVWLLSVLFESPFASALTFKGGTSLSKAYRVIDRFSEDIDLTYDIRELVPDLIQGGSPIPGSRSQAKRLTDAVRERLPRWLDETVVPRIQEALSREHLKATVTRDGENPERLLVDYGSVRHGTGYVAPRVLLDFGARSTGEPHELKRITCDMAEYVPDILFPEAIPQTLKIARTFWEKATAAHVYCAQIRTRGDRFSRHWHDLAAIMTTEHFEGVVGDREVAMAVAAHKSVFFIEKDRSGSVIDYHLAVGGALKIVPEDEARIALEADYKKMIEDGLLLREPRSFEELMRDCSELQYRANRLGT